MTPRPAMADRPARILIVDDEPANRSLLTVMLEPEGFDLQTAGTGEEALDMVARQPADVVLLDIMMPGMDGYQVAAAIKGNPETSTIAIIMVTAMDDRGARMEGLKAGAEDFLSKPVDRAELVARVRNQLRLKRANEELADALAEAREARLMAEHANSAKTVFLRAMSHELRTPLNAITGYTEILELGIRGEVNPAQVKDLGRIKRAASYLLRLINDVLTVARLEGARPLHFAALAVTPMLEEVEGLCALQAREKGVTLSIAPATCDSAVIADSERFQQILLNLVTNAVKFSTAGDSVTVSCSSEGNKVHIKVADTGVGIRAADVNRVFDPFVQIDRHLTVATHQGVGLGLSISRELARAMSGDLTLESTEGAGSVFTLSLPSAAGMPVPAAAPAQERALV